MQTQVLGLSVDSIPCLKAWADSLGGITYPLLSDFFPHGQVARRYGVLRPEGYAERAIFVIDKQGIIRYVDVYPLDQQPNNDDLFQKLAALEPQAAGKIAALTSSALPEAKADVVLYCTPWCPDCRRAREYLRRQGVAYVEVDISRDRAAAARVRGWANGNETTPTFDIGGTIIVDYDEARVAEALKRLKG